MKLLLIRWVLIEGMGSFLCSLFPGYAFWTLFYTSCVIWYAISFDTFYMVLSLYLPIKRERKKKKPELYVGFSDYLVNDPKR